MNVLWYAPNQAANFGLNSFYQKRICKYDRKADPVKYNLSYFLAGGLAGSSAITIFYPFDFLKTKIATDVGKSKADWELGGVFNCLKIVYNKEGIWGFYTGLSLSLFVVFVYWGIYFGGSALGKMHLDIINEYKSIKFVYYHLLSISAGVLLHPLDTVRRRLMLQTGRENASRDYFSIPGTV